MAQRTKSRRPHGVYTSSEAVGLTLDVIEDRKVAISEGRAVSGLFGIKELDDYLVPIWPRDLMYIAALPSNGKSFTARMFEQRVVNALIDHDDGSRVGVWITTEESVEKIGAHWLAAMSGVSSTDMLSGKLGETQQVTVNASVAEVGSWPLWVMGHSGGARNEHGIIEKTARLSTNEIDACIDFIMNKKGKDIAFLTIDYIHRIRSEGGSDREAHIRNCVDWSRDVAVWTNSPVVVCAQSKSKVGDKKYAMPGIPDVEWSMNAGQSADVMLGLWMPKTTLGVGGIVENFGGFNGLVVEGDMMFVGVAKQKDGPAGDMFLLRVKPHMMQWELLEIQQIELNPSKNKETDTYNPWASQQGPINF